MQVNFENCHVDIFQTNVYKWACLGLGVKDTYITILVLVSPMVRMKTLDNMEMVPFVVTSAVVIFVVDMRYHIIVHVLMRTIFINGFVSMVDFALSMCV